MNSEHISAIILIVSFIVGFLIAVGVSLSILRQQDERRKDKILRKKAKEREKRLAEEEQARKEKLRIIEETYVKDEKPDINPLRDKLNRKKESSWTEFESEAENIKEADIISERRKTEDSAYHYVKRKQRA